MVCRVSNVKCDFQFFYFFVRVYFDEEKPAFDRFSSYFLLDKVTPNPAKGLYLISGMKCNYLYHIITTSICGCCRLVVAAKI